VLILSYETFRAHKEAMTSFPLDLLILDEGHRIKNVTAQISKALALVKTRRRVLLTGTPLQNDLKEFYAMVDFCNPSILGTPKFFSEFFDKPIMQSRDISMSDSKREAGEKKFQELSSITNTFMLRRSNQILEDYLPPKSEQVVFCRPSESQVLLYRFFLGSKTLRQAMADGAASSSSLECISLLTKLCNYPGLVRAKAVSYLAEQDEEDVPLGKRTTIDSLFPEFGEDSPVRPDLSGKLTVLDSLLGNVRKTTDDRVVVVSNFTKTLDVVQELCAVRGWKFFRLDGKTEQTKRQTYVDSFNRPSSDVFVFLLSSKAGGTGLNLVGANRLVLFDSDWNPATDRQAMARVWRDGQLKRVFLYRLLMTGSIDEKIFQRQLSKEGLSSSVLDNAFGKVQFSRTDLKDIFSLNVGTICDTHDLVCDCFRKSDEGGSMTKAVARGAGVDISRWQHLNNMEKLDDKALKLVSASEPEAITAVFLLHTDGKKYVYEKKEEEEEKMPIAVDMDDAQALDLDDE
jgi:SNF2 family DNA or RNA helicase